MSLLFRWRSVTTVAIVVAWLMVPGTIPEMFQATFHIDKGNPKCLDVGGNGSEATPYCTMAHAATIANAGNIFLVHGPKHGDAPTTFTRPGTALNPITWRAVGYVAVSKHIDIDDTAFTPSEYPGVWQIPWTEPTAKCWQTFFPDIVVDDENQTYFTLKDEDGPLVMTMVGTEADIVAHDGTCWRNAANGRLLVHPYGGVTPSNTTTDFVVALSNALTIDTKANYQIFDGFTITYTTGTSAQVLSSNNKLYNMHYVGQPLDIRGQTNYGENITINHGIWRQGPLWDWDTEGEGATGGFSFGTGHVMKNLHVFNSWNSTFNSEGTVGNTIDGGQFHGAANHCTGAGNGNHTIRNAVWYNCQDYQWLFDPVGITMEHVLIPGGGVSMSAIEGNIGPITIRNSIWNGKVQFVRGTGTAAGLPYDGCTWEVGSLMEYNLIQADATIERCDTQISYPIDEYVARCATGEFTGCMTIRNNIKIPGADWAKVMVEGMWRGQPPNAQGDSFGPGPLGEFWDFHLVPGAPAINAGMVSGALTDLIGISRPQPVGGLYDIGPYEFTPGGDPAPTGKPIVAAPAAVTTTITAPTSAATYDAGTSATLTTLAGTSKSGRTITGCTWANSLGGSGSTSGTTSWTIASVALTVGSNVITVTCTNDGKTTGADIITVTRSSGGGGAWACEDTHTAASTTLAAVQTAIGLADDGDCVNIPAGTSTWASALTVTGKAIQIRGNNGTPVTTPGTRAQCDVGGQTTYTCIKGGDLLRFTPSATGNARVTGITWYSAGCVSCSGAFGDHIINIGGNNKNFRFDHNRIDPANTGIKIGGHVNGVVDHNIVTITEQNAHSLTVVPDQWNGTSDGSGDLSWVNAHTKGTGANIIIEDNTFQNTSGVPSFDTDGLNGCRFVMRFNTFQNGSVQIHGTETSGRLRGCRHIEVYHNTFASTNSAGLGSFRGGSGYFFNNTMTGTVSGSALFGMTTLRQYDTDWAGHGGVAGYPWGRCSVQTVGAGNLTRSGTTATLILPNNWTPIQSNAGWITVAGATQTQYNGTFRVNGISQTTVTYQVAGSPATPATGSITAFSPFDGNQDSTGWPCLDQAGSGLGEVTIAGEGPACDCPPMTPNPTTQVVKMNNALEPIACFGNTDDGAASNCVSDSEAIIKANRDYYNGNTSCTGASCTAGVGIGTTLPTGCTPTAVGPQTSQTGPYFWKTNSGEWNSTNGATADGQMYRCSAANTWTVFYTPYTYPHPLVQ